VLPRPDVYPRGPGHTGLGVGVYRLYPGAGATGAHACPCHSTAVRLSTCVSYSTRSIAAAASQHQRRRLAVDAALRNSVLCHRRVGRSVGHGIGRRARRVLVRREGWCRLPAWSAVARLLVAHRAPSCIEVHRVVRGTDMIDPLHDPAAFLAQRLGPAVDPIQPFWPAGHSSRWTNGQPPSHPGATSCGRVVLG
jgi:hypothetical protein